ncbi:hypothetical protein MHY1_03224 [Methylovirgula sp. HY1]|nr:hypothetical protein MHY1_03224 [Methylovirgula sp. HY1]
MIAMTNLSDADCQKTLLDDFVRSVLRRYAAMDTHDNKTQRACIENMIRITRELDAMPPDGRAALTKLFEHEELGVRVMAAAYLLNVMPEKVLPFLQEVQDNCYGDEAIDATTALFIYRAGDWDV